MIVEHLPIVCTLGPEAIAARKANLLATLASRVTAREDLPDGMRFRFSAEDLSAVMTMVDQERRCCRFLQFDVRVEPDSGPVWVALSGPPGTRDFLLAMIDG
jgi:hypothetical protein